VLEQLHTLMATALDRRDTQVDALPMDDVYRMRARARAADRISAAVPTDRPVDEMVRHRADEQPDAEAIGWRGGAVSDRELDHETAMVAAHLQALGGVNGSAVAVRMPAGPRPIAASLGVLRAGGHLVWFGAGEAGQRRRAVLACWFRDELDGRILNVAASDRTGPTPALSVHTGLDSLAYVAYTSGSTGKPKGIAQTQLADVEAVLAEHDSVAEVVVVPVTNSDGLVNRLLAYVVPRPTRGGPVGSAEVWRAHLRRRFGPSMGLASFRTMTRPLARNTGGKIDRRRLPDPGPDVGAVARQPQTPGGTGPGRDLVRPAARGTARRGSDVLRRGRPLARLQRHERPGSLTPSRCRRESL
jgi:acyl-coenzyme A synthetase/AMP-(fatty) acid ligase